MNSQKAETTADINCPTRRDALKLGAAGAAGLVLADSLGAAPAQASSPKQGGTLRIGQTLDIGASNDPGTFGTSGNTIEDARITGTALDVNETFSAMFTTEQAARYDAHAVMEVEILDERGMPRAFARGEATRSRTMPEGLTLRDRDQLLFELTEALIADLNAALEPNIEQYLGAYLR